MNNCGYAAYQHKRETYFVILSGVFKVGELVEPPEENEVEGSKEIAPALTSRGFLCLNNGF